MSAEFNFLSRFNPNAFGTRHSRDCGIECTALLLMQSDYKGKTELKNTKP